MPEQEGFGKKDQVNRFRVGPPQTPHDSLAGGGYITGHSRALNGSDPHKGG